MNSILQTISDFINQVGFEPFLVFSLLLGMYLFWREAILTKKDSNSVFDQMVWAFFFMILFSRVSYFIVNWSDEFSQLEWFYLPYERYVDKVYLFRLMPWKFFAIWDGGLLFSGMLLGFIVSNLFFVRVIKRWSFKDMLKPVFASAEMMLGIIFLSYGFFLNSAVTSILGACLIVLTVVFIIFDKRVLPIPAIIYVLGTLAINGFIFLSAGVTLVDQINVLLSVLLGLIICALYYIEFKFPLMLQKKEEVIMDLKPEVAPNKAIKAKKGGWRV